MYYLRQTILDPLAREYNRYIDGYYLSNLLQVKGGKQAGNDYISKVFRSKYHDIQQRYDSSVQSIRNPTYSQFLQDNLVRLLGLNALQRLIAAYQAYPILKARAYYPGTLSHTFTQITNQGLFSGILKGSLLAAAQLSLVLFPATYMANKSQNKFSTFVGSFALLDAALYPVDTIKNILYSETHAGLKLRTALGQTTLSSLYRGLAFKMLFNIPYATSLYLSTQGSDTSAWISWLVTGALYPLNTFKVRSQLMGTRFAISSQVSQATRVGLYRGVVPFILLNALFGWSLRPLFSQQRLDQIREEVKSQQRRTIGKA